MISSLDNQRVKNWTRLHLKKYRHNEYLLLDEKLVLEAYKCGYLKTLIYVKDKPFEFLESYEVSKEVLNKISKNKNLSYIGIGKIIEEKEFSGKRVMILDELQDPLNVGRIMESAYLFGFKTIVLSENTVDIYNDKCLKASKGAIYHLNILRRDLLTFLPLIKDEYYLIATGLKDNTKDLRDLSLSDKMAFILGNEGSGVRDEIFAMADDTLKIEMHNIDSLNVAMAGAIIMYNYKEEK